MNLNLKDKNALVCGSSKGIGKATAMTLASMGANVTLLARNEELLNKVAHELDVTNGQNHGFEVVDFSNRENLRNIITSLLTQRNYHILINNTGGPAGGPITQATEEQFLNAFQNHLLCNQLLTTMLMEGMKQDNYGRVINIISTSIKSPIPGLGVSNTTRGAVASWAKTISNELAPFGISVNNVLPGFTSTERLKYIIETRAKQNNKSFAEMEEMFKSVVPMNRFAKPEEVAGAIGFLASPIAAYITGTSILVDGGRTKSIS